MIKLLRRWKKEKRMNRFYKNIIHPGDLCFDIGANRGRYIELFLNARAKVIAIEPQENCMKLLKHKFSESGQIHFIKVAVGSEKSKAKLFIGNNDEVSTMSADFKEAYARFDWNKWPTEEEVDVVTLDELIAEFGVPQFCKIDVEGWETEVLKGLTKAIPMISLEYNLLLREKAIDCVNLLTQLSNYEFNFSPYESCEFQMKKWLSANEFKTYLSELSSEIQHGDIFARLPVGILVIDSLKS